MLDKILKDRFLNLLFGTVVFIIVAFILVGSSAILHFSSVGILLVGYFLGLIGSDWTSWLEKKCKELNS